MAESRANADGAGARAARPLRPQSSLLDLDGRARALELLLGRVGGLLVDPLQDRLRGAVDEVLGLLEAEARERADLLDDLDLLLAGGGENDVERVLLLLLDGGSATSAGRGGGGDGGS